jgi:predicted dehydrogenase
VLRYSPFFREIRKAITDGKIGRVITIQHNENIGNFHIAHSFVRGNWRRSDLSSPLIMQKSCHDMDLLVWLTGSRCSSIASFGDLTYFRGENAPAGSGRRCCDCPLKDSCRFSAYRCYLPVAGDWPAAVLTEDQSEEGLREAIRTGPYGRCVYRCDNNVCDHQVSILRFDNGVTATFNLSGFTDRMTRTIKIMGEDGEIRASEAENEIEIIRFASTGREAGEREVIRPEVAQSGHSGGDSGIVEDFLAMLEGRLGTSATDIRESVESHMMACAAEEARLTGTVVRIADFRRRHERKQQA